MRIGRLLAAASAMFPLPEVLLLNRTIAANPEDPERLDELWEIAGSLGPEGQAAARDIYADDASRLRRLEDKLGGQTQIAALLLAPVVAVLGAAVHRSPWVAFPLAVLATVYIAAALYLTSHATRATRTAMPQPSHLKASDENLPLRDYAYEELRAVSFNAPRGVQIANAIYGAQRCLFAAGVLLVAAAVVLAAGVFDSDAKPSTPKPSPTRSP